MSKRGQSGASVASTSLPTNRSQTESNAQLSCYAKQIVQSRFQKKITFRKEYRDGASGRHVVEVTIPSKQGRIRVVWSFDLQGEIRMQKAKQQIASKGKTIRRFPRLAKGDDGRKRFPRLAKLKNKK